MSDWTRGRRALVLLAGVLTLMVFVALLTPESTGDGRTGDDRLSTRLAGPQGARLLYELADRLGWTVARRDTSALPAGPAGRTIHAVLDPKQPVAAKEAHALLERVRAGDALLFVLSDERTPLADSLDVRHGFGFPYEAPDPRARPCPSGRQGAVALWANWRAHLYELRWLRTTPAPLTEFARVGSDSAARSNTRVRSAVPIAISTHLAAAGFPLGRGRVAVVADPDLLRNDVLRVCAWQADVVAVRMLEFLSTRDDGAARRQLVLFDEYHQGFGARPGTLRAIGAYLSRHATGHLMLQLLLAGLVWLLAAGPRALSPRDPHHVERRSPLEHVRALAVAYAQVGATRTATARLVRGVRRRAARAGRGVATDDEFLAWVQRVAPARDADVALVRRALAVPVSRHELATVGVALGRIESSLATLSR